jgi:hypothetical protein
MGATPGPENPEHASTIEERTIEGTLDFNWWASDGPTGGYLISLAMEATTGTGQAPCTQKRSLDLSIVGSARADHYQASLVTLQSGSRSDTAIVFQQNNVPFAIASLRGSPSERAALISSSLPAVLPPKAYDEMDWKQPSPPVTSQFSYRPIVSPDGTSPLSDWDQVWIRPTSIDAIRYRPTAVIDSWYPANFMRSVREFLRGATSVLLESSATKLLTVHATIAHPQQSLAPGEHVLLASRLMAASSSHYDEQFEIWSESGHLLSAGRIIRRAAPTRSNPRLEQPRLQR